MKPNFQFWVNYPHFCYWVPTWEKLRTTATDQLSVWIMLFWKVQINRDSVLLWGEISWHSAMHNRENIDNKRYVESLLQYLHPCYIIFFWSTLKCTSAVRATTPRHMFTAHKSCALTGTPDWIWPVSSQHEKIFSTPFTSLMLYTLH